MNIAQILNSESVEVKRLTTHVTPGGSDSFCHSGGLPRLAFSLRLGTAE